PLLQGAAPLRCKRVRDAARRGPRRAGRGGGMSARVVITGAASGIGEATAEELHRRGATVAGLDLNASGDLIACDVRDQASVDAAVADAVALLGGIDVLINCAGVGDPQSAAEPPGDDALRVLD